MLLVSLYISLDGYSDIIEAVTTTYSGDNLIYYIPLQVTTDGIAAVIAQQNIFHMGECFNMETVCLSVCRSGLHDPKAYSLLGGVVPTQSIG